MPIQKLVCDTVYGNRASREKMQPKAVVGIHGAFTVTYI